MLFTVLLICVLAPAVSSSYVNEFDQPFLFKCASGQSISNIRSVHSNRHEDRRYGFSCKDTPGLGRCSAHVLNKFDETFLFQCPHHGVISGMYSYHDNRREDRRFKIYCCDLRGKVMQQCLFTDFVNNWDAPMNYVVDRSRFLRGIYSVHNNHREDRRFKFETCLAN